MLLQHSPAISTPQTRKAGVAEALLLSVLQDCTARVWDLEAGKSLHCLEGALL